jgi:U3 small nucleolar RNA-associated protein 10
MFLMSVDRNDAPWGFLNAYKSAAQSMPRTALVTEMLRNVVVARFVASALPKAIKEKTAHHALIAFHTSVLFEYISRAKALDDAALMVLLPAMLEPLQESAIRSDVLTKDVTVSLSLCPYPSPTNDVDVYQLSSYVLLSALSQKCALRSHAVQVILDAMASCSSRVAPQQFVNAALSVLSPQGQLDDFPGLFIQTVLGLP